jgi:23S rRNA (uracil1939-C5)-methyltransferase
VFRDAALTGLTATWVATEVGGRPGSPSGEFHVLDGSRTVCDAIHPAEAGIAPAIRIRRDARAFFQGNRYLLEPFVRHVLARVPFGPVMDLYAGVGLFGLSAAARGADEITLVEGDPISGLDLEENAAPFGPHVRVHRMSVERFLRRTTQGQREARGSGTADCVTVIVDPPRTGMTPDALAALAALAPARVVFVSCDPATLARDLRVLTSARYQLEDVTVFDLFPNTAHIETVAYLVAS